MDHTRSGSTAFGWDPAWDTYDDPALGGVKKYDLPKPDSLGENRRFSNQRIHEGERFWDAEEHWLLTITDVRTKVYRGVVGPQGEEGDDAVFYETDYNPRRRGGMFNKPHHPNRDDEPFHVSAEEFAQRIVDGRFVPHTGNGIEAPP